MLFNSFPFIFVFLPIAAGGYFLAGAIAPRLAAAWLAAASLAFYGYWSPRALLLLAGSIGVNFILSRSLAPAPDRGERARRRLMYVSVVANLTLLGIFKYANFFVSDVNAIAGLVSGLRLQTLHVVLPIGISFYTFTQIAFLVDTWKGDAREPSFVHYVLFVTYFPHLVAGPILHHRQMLPQFADPATRRPQSRLITLGLCLFAIGLAKKLVLADQLSGYADTLFLSVAAGVRPMLLMSWLGSLAYTLQLYFDFSGYSDMAIGLSLLLGIRMPFNFDSPLKATSVIDFWRRWHMSLGAFLRDYVYIPLGGNRGGPRRHAITVLTTMTLCGLWHGASWTFVSWGAIHGGLLVVNRTWRRLTGSTGAPRGAAGTVAAWTLTFVCVCAAFTLFRAPTFQIAMQIYAGMLGLNGVAALHQITDAGVWQGANFMTQAPLIQGGSGGPIMIALALLVCLAFPNANTLAEPREQAERPIAPRLSLALGFACGLLFLIGLGLMNRPSPFVYFQF